MDALQTVFDTILKVLNIIKKFFEDLFGKNEAEEEETTAAPEV